jgi:hypothetical protein
MPSTFDPLLRLELQATGENATTWGTKTNNNLDLLAEAISGAVNLNLAGSGDFTLTTANGAEDQARYATLVLTGTLTGNRNLIIPSSPKNYNIINQTSGAFTITVKQAAGTGFALPAAGPTIAVATSTTCIDAVGTTPYSKSLLAATSVDAALSVLGSTNVGRAVFKAVDTSAARSAIGATTVGSALIIAANAAAGRTAIGAAATGPVGSSGVTMNTSRLLGRTTGSSGAVEEITVGTGLTLAGGSLAVSSGTIVDRAYTEYTTYAALTAQIPLDDTIPQNSEGTQILSASITPKTATNRVRVRAVVRGLIQDSANRVGTVSLFRGAGADAIAATNGSLYAGGAQIAQTLVLEFEDSPASTSSQTYNIRVGPSGGTLYINGNSSARLYGGVMRATLVLEEITA